MSTQTNPTDSTLAGADGNVAASAGGAAVDPNTLTLAEMNTFLGKDFKDKDAALKAVKDTFAFVGKRKEDIEAEIRSNLEATAPKNPDLATKSDVLSLQKQLFYAQNPQFKDHQALIEKMGANPAEVVEMPEFKSVFEKVKVADELEQKRSVVSSSARLGQSKDYATEAVKVANARGSSSMDVAMSLARAVNEVSGK